MISVSHESPFERIERIAMGGPAEQLDGDERRRIVASRAVVDRAAEGASAVYGVTTGFGALASVKIDPAGVRDLQRNIVRSHAVGTGPALDRESARAMMLVLSDSLRRGRSGVRMEVVELLLGMLAADVVPEIPSRGSVGASGDLAPLAHLALVLIGEGRASVAGVPMAGDAALARAGLQPVELGAKEGLALVNGTHLMTAVGGLSVLRAARVLETAIVAAATTVEALMGSHGPFDERISRARNQNGQLEVARRMSELLAGSEIMPSHRACGRVQDPYSLRCVPAVLGAALDGLTYVRGVLEAETAAVTDNPLVFAEDDAILSGGNFHGQPLALALDHAALIMAQVAGFSERRVYALLAPGPVPLPAFLAPEPGVTSGLMITQYTCAALVNECHVLAHPSSASSLPTSAGMEDWNSMGATSALKAAIVVGHAAHVVATELVCASHALLQHRPLRSSAAVEAVVECVLNHVPPLQADRSVASEIEALRGDVASGAVARSSRAQPAGCAVGAIGQPAQ